MKRYFVVSDVHSFYSELMCTLNKCGFDINNDDHIFILCGDLFDRGNESLELYNFIKSIPKNRRILIRGNHEYLMRDLLNKKYPDSYDISNGTVRTLCNLSNCSDNMFAFTYFLTMNDINLIKEWKKIIKEIKSLGVSKWIMGDEWVNYFELDNYIFVHSFIPLKDDNTLPVYYTSGPSYSYVQEWRDLSKGGVLWEGSTWGCPWRLYKEGLFKEEEEQGKTLVCGHWQCSDFHKEFENIEDNNEMYVGEHLIGLDGCTVLSGFVNCLVLDVENGKVINRYDRNMNIV